MDFLLKRIEQILRYQKRWKKWQKVVASLACVVVFITTYALILPAITMDRDEAQSQGGISWEEMQEAEGTVASADAQGADQDGILSAEEANLIAGSELDVSEEQAEMDVVGEENSAGEGTLNPEAASERPAAIFDEVAGDVTVHVEAPEGAFPVGTTMKVEPVEDSQVMAAVQNAVEDPVTKVSAVDIIFLDASGNEIEPAAEIKVSMSSTVMENVEQPVIVHVDEEGVGETVESEQVDGTVVFESDRFSVYVIVGTETVETQIQTASGETLKVTVEVTDKNDITKFEGLRVTELDLESAAYKKAYDAVVSEKEANDAEFDKKDIGFFAADIALLDASGEEFEPVGLVKLTMEFINLPADEETLVSTMEVQHLKDKGGYIDVQTVAKAEDVDKVDNVITAEFTVDSFSTFTLTWGDKSATIHWGTTDENENFSEFEASKVATLDTTAASISLANAFDGYSYLYTYATVGDSESYQVDSILKREDGEWKWTKTIFETDGTSSKSTETIPDGSDIYVVYSEPVARPSGASNPDVHGPDTLKTVEDNKDGTYTVQLDVSAPIVQESDSQGANVLIVLDRTMSMDTRMPNSTHTRWQAAKAAVDNLVTILKSEENANNDIDFGLLTFNTTGYMSQHYVGIYPWGHYEYVYHLTEDDTLYRWNNSYWTKSDSDYNSIVQGLSLPESSMTNWQSPLNQAKTILNTRDSDQTYVIFITDGEPNVRGTSLQQDGITYGGDVVTPALNLAKDITAMNNVTLYGVFCGDASGYTTLNNMINQAGGASTINGTDEEGLKRAFGNIAHYIINNLGSSNVSLDDGIPSLSSVSAKTTGEASGFEYLKKGPDDSNFETWTDAPGASYSNDNGVTWDLSAAGTLAKDTTYRLKFTVWPSQNALDLIANLNNGTVTMTDDELEAAGIAHNKTTGKYTLKTNTHLNTTYTYKGTTYTDPANPLVSEDMSLPTERMTLAKDWSNNITAKNKYQSVSFLLKEDGKYYTENGTLSDQESAAKRFVLNNDNDWKTSLYIAPGIVRNGTVLETGHEYTLEEPKSGITLSDGTYLYDYEFKSQTVHPMIINGTLTYLVKVDNYNTGTGYTRYDLDLTNRTLTQNENGAYYAVLVAEGSNGTITGTNRKTAELDITKVIKDNTGNFTDAQLDAETFTYRVTLTVPADADITGITAYEYVPRTGEGRITINGYQESEDESKQAIASDVTNFSGKTFGPYTVTAQTTIRDGIKYHTLEGMFAGSGDTKTATVDITLKRNEIIRFTNLPEGTTYTITEMYNNYRQADPSKDDDASGSDMAANIADQGYSTTVATKSRNPVTDTARTGSVEGTTVTGTIDYLDVRYYNQFTNTLNDVIDVELTGTKHLDGYEWSGESYYFNLAATNNAPLPIIGANGRVRFYLTEASGTAKKSYSFGKIRFTKAGTYTYTIQEDNAETLQVVNGTAVQYGGAETITIVIAENQGKLSVESVTNNSGHTVWDATNKVANTTITNTVPVTTASATKAWLNADGTSTAPTDASVVFTLYADGNATDKTVTLDGTVDAKGEATAWEATFSDLPQYKVVNGEAVEIEYTIGETTPWTGYDLVIPEGASDPYTVESGGSITNRQKTLWVQFKKTDMDGDRDGHRLAGAIFTFNDGVKTSDITVTSASDGIMATIATATEASVNKFQLAVRTDPYVLTETKAPDGYNKLTGVVNVTVGTNGVSAKLGDTVTQYTVTGTGTEEDPYVVIITNSSGEELPMTGGPGTLPYTLGGIVLMLGAALMYGFRMRRRERRLN